MNSLSLEGRRHAHLLPKASPPLLSASKQSYRGTSLIRTPPPLRTTIEPYTYTYCRVLGWGGFL